MSDDRIPKIPSFEELGISEDEIEELERELEREAKEGAGGEDAAPLPGPGEGRANDAGDGRRGAGPVPGTAPTPDTGAPPGPSAKTAPATKSEVVPAALPWRGWRGPLTLLLLLALAWSSSSFRVPPSPAPASAPDSVFSSARAMSHLAVIASEARPTGSPAHGRVRDHLLGQLRALGHEPVVQTATSVTEYGPFARAATVRNILARIPGSRPGGEAVLVTAHYDSRGISRGAGDDGSGVVAILETLRALGTRAPLRNDLIVLLTDAEELGLLGAQAFVDEHPWMEDVALVVSIEMRGGGGPSMMFETGAGNGWVIEALRRANPRPAANSVASEVYRRMPNDTDFTLFKEAGKQGLNFAGVARAHLYHQVYDSPENFSEATLQHQGVQVMAMLRHFGDADLGAVDAPDVSYVSLPIVGLVTYGAPWIWALGVACAGLWTGVLLVGRRRGSRLPGVLVGFLASAVQLGAAAAAGFYLYDWRRGAHPETGALHAGAFHSEGWYVLAIVSAAFLFTILSLALLRRWFTLAELSVGALFAPVALAAVSAVMFPMAAVNFQLPALAGCLGALAVVGGAPERAGGLLALGRRPARGRSRRGRAHTPHGGRVAGDGDVPRPGAGPPGGARLHSGLAAAGHSARTQRMVGSLDGGGRPRRLPRGGGVDRDSLRATARALDARLPHGPGSRHRPLGDRGRAGPFRTPGSRGPRRSRDPSPAGRTPRPSATSGWEASSTPSRWPTPWRRPRPPWRS